MNSDRKKCSKCKKWLSRSQFSKNITKKDGRQNWCKTCAKVYHQTNKKEIKAHHKTYYATNKEDQKANSRAYYQAHKEKAKARIRSYYQKHKKEKAVYGKGWRRENKGLVKANVRKYQAAKLNRTLEWLTPEQLQQIKDFYLNCPEGMVVDHIIPLRGKYVSGLHHPDNLQYLTESENSSKRNNYPVEGR